jgi:hypothetical protein
MNWEMYGVAAVCLLAIWLMIRDLRKTINKRFDRLDESFDCVDTSLSEICESLIGIRDHLAEVRERLTFLEAASIYTMPLEPIQPNARSQAAKEVWVRRRQKKLEKKDG